MKYVSTYSKNYKYAHRTDSLLSESISTIIKILFQAEPNFNFRRRAPPLRCLSKIKRKGVIARRDICSKYTFTSTMHKLSKND